MKTNNLKSYIGLRIKFIRNTRHMTITDVAKQLGVSRKQYQNYEQLKTLVYKDGFMPVDGKTPFDL